MNQTKPSNTGPIVHQIKSLLSFPSVVSNHQTSIRSLDPFNEPQRSLPLAPLPLPLLLLVVFHSLSLSRCHSTPAAAACRAATVVTTCMSLFKWMQNLLTAGRVCASVLTSRRGAEVCVTTAPAPSAHVPQASGSQTHALFLQSK